nr:MAG TPA: hypothetical protein [Caudoviricetes sp.]
MNRALTVFRSLNLLKILRDSQPYGYLFSPSFI